MAKVNLKNIIGKKNDIAALIQSLLHGKNDGICIEDENGKLLLGEMQAQVNYQYPVKLEDEILGWVKGGEKAAVIADFLTVLSKKESEKKKLGSEVLNLYQEINLIFNFSEKLAETIDPAVIAQITLDETGHLIRSDSGVVVLWDETSEQLKVIASKGELFFNEDEINSKAGVLYKIALSSQSEIISDVSQLPADMIVPPDVKSIIYAALKVKHRIMGAIVLASYELIQYAAADLKLLTTLALQSSSAIESALLYEKNIREAKEREEAMRRIYEAAGRFVPYEFIGLLGHEVITDVRLGDQVEKIVTVLFSDIRDYTSFSEQMTPEENFKFIHSFNELIGPIIRKHRGFINQYLGDAIMAIFTGSAADALAAAVEMQKAMQEFNRKRQKMNQQVIQIGIGMHTGPLIMGITGDQHRMDATTISDTVNTASRIESLTKYYKANIILSNATLQQIDDTQNFHLRYLGMVQVKGKQEPVSIHECFSGNSYEQLQKKQATLSFYNEGLSSYLKKSFGKAFMSFQIVSEENPEDQTVNFFLSKAANYITGGVPENWIGVEEMTGK